jgi:hypothetical protein
MDIFFFWLAFLLSDFLLAFILVFPLRIFWLKNAIFRANLQVIRLALRDKTDKGM